MQASAWRELLARIPIDQHNNLVLLTSAACEISLQDLIFLQQEYVVVRGRLSGTTDTGRIFFVPYDQITYLGLTKPVPESFLHGMYNQQPPQIQSVPVVVEEVPAVVETPAEAPPASSAPAEPEPAPPHSPAPNRHETPSGLVNRRELLERLRQRSQGGVSKANRS